MSRRLGVVLLAVLLGILGTAAVAAYVKRADKGTTATQQNQQITTVLAATGPIPAGTTANAAAQKGLIGQEQLPANLVPTGALTDLSSVGTLVAVNDVAPSQVLVSQLFAADAPTGALTIPNGKMAVSLQLVDPTQRVAGFVAPGSDVAIFDYYQPHSSAGGSTPPSKATRLLVSRAEVAAVGPTSVTQSQADTTVATTLMTVALTQRQSEQVIQASHGGTLYFALLTSRAKASNSPGTNDSNLFR
jgi:pilus assembly protein CpaB